MGQIGLIRWIMNIFTDDSRKVNSLHQTFLSRTLRPQIGPRHFTCDKVESKKNWDRIEGLMLDNWGGAHAGPMPCIKVTLSFLNGM